MDGTEFGIDGTFSYSSGGIKSGTVGVGLKYGFVFNKNLILGPSIRYQRRWTNNTVITSYSIHYTKLYEFAEIVPDPVVFP